MVWKNVVQQFFIVFSELFHFFPFFCGLENRSKEQLISIFISLCSNVSEGFGGKKDLRMGVSAFCPAIVTPCAKNGATAKVRKRMVREGKEGKVCRQTPGF